MPTDEATQLVHWHHTGRPSWAAAGWDDRMGRYARHSKTHATGEGITNCYGEEATLCGVTLPSGHMVYSLTRGATPSPLQPMCKRCEAGLLRRQAAMARLAKAPPAAVD